MKPRVDEVKRKEQRLIEKQMYHFRAYVAQQTGDLMGQIDSKKPGTLKRSRGFEHLEAAAGEMTSFGRKP